MAAYSPKARPEPPQLFGASLDKNENTVSSGVNHVISAKAGRSSVYYNEGYQPDDGKGSPDASTSKTTYFVSPDGADAAPGTKSQPWRSIKTAAKKLRAGDTLVVLPGKYNELIRPYNSGSKTAPIRYIGYGAVIDGTGLGNKPLFTIYNKSNIHIEGFEFQNSERSGILIASYDNKDVTGISIDKVIVHDTGRSGIVVSDINKPSYTYITNSTVYRTRQAGIVLWNNRGGHFLIEGNDVSEWQGINNWDGIEIVDTPYTVVRGNTVHDGGSGNKGADYIDAGGDQTQETSFTHHIVIEGNTVYKSSGSGALKINNRPRHVIMRRNLSRKVPMVFYEQPHTHVTVYHNTIVDTEYHPLQLWNQDIPGVSFGGMIVKNNIFAFGSKGLQHGPLDMDGTAQAVLMTCNLYRPTSAWDWKSSTSPSDYFNVETSEAEYQRWRQETKQEPGDLGIRTMLPRDRIFADIASLDFSLIASSPGIDKAAPLTHIRESGSGTVLLLENSDYFFDGYHGLTLGDLIEIGQQGVARILKINEQTHEIRIDRKMNWKRGDPVYLAGKMGSAPDIGAVESF